MHKEIDEAFVRSVLKPREQNSNKGTFGTLQLFCGSRNMPGAAFLACIGALRCGVGLLYVSADDSVQSVLKTRLAEPVYCNSELSCRASAFLAGCGSAENASVCELLLAQEKPVILDADCITYLSHNCHILYGKRCDVLITPHTAELSRLCGKSTDEIEASREQSALDTAREFGITVLLKGHRTVIAGPDGTLFVNTTGNSGLAKGGSGDVLAGMIGSFVAQGIPLAESAAAAAWLHGKASEYLSAELYSERGMLPSDIPTAAAFLLRGFDH